ncbi:MAG: exonuclease SbcCD subunit D, partial [Actinomycetota bacterium]
MPRRLVHAADLHLDSPFTGLGSVRDGLDGVLLDASLDALDDLVELCLAEDAEVLLLAGDQFDRAEGSSRGRQRLARACATLTAAGTAVFAVHGNHDPLRGRSPLADVDGVTVFRPGRPQTHAV